LRCASIRGDCALARTAAATPSGIINLPPALFMGSEAKGGFCVMRYESAVRFLLSLLSVACLLLAPMPAQAKRVAFVIGVNDYVHLDGAAQLKRAINDARGVGEALRGLGFQLMLVENPRRSEFNAEWQQFLGAIEPGDEVAFFYSGHGVEIDGQNFLVPADIPKISFGRQEQIKRESLSVSELLLDLRRRKPRVSLVILDACRDHPFAPSEWKASEKPGGLARMDAPHGTFVMYSAWAGERALDRLPSGDPDPTHSVYTRKLLPLLTTPGLNLTELAKRVRQEVHTLTAAVAHPQTPAYYDGILGDYCLAGCDSPPATQSSSIPPRPASSATVYEDSAQRLLYTFQGHSNLVHSVAFSPDGRFALSGSADQTFTLWDMKTRKQVRHFQSDLYAVRSIRFSPNGRSALSAEGWVAKHWELGTGKELRVFEGHGSSVTSVAFSSDGLLALSGSSDMRLKLWDVATGKELRTLSGHSNWVSSVAFSPDGRFVLSGSYDNTLKLWEIHTGNVVQTFRGHSGWINSVAFSPDGRFVLCGSSDATLNLWDVTSPLSQRTFLGHSSPVNAVAFSPDGRFVVSGGGDNTVKLWDVGDDKELRSFSGHSHAIYSVAVSPDGRSVLSGSDDNTLKLWDVSEWTQPRSHDISSNPGAKNQ
jgi:hypothetical protein